MVRKIVLILACCMPMITIFSAEPKSKKGLETLLRSELKMIDVLIRESDSADEAMGMIMTHIIESPVQAQLSTSAMITSYGQKIAKKFNQSPEEVTKTLNGIFNEGAMLSHYSTITTDLIIQSDSLYQAAVAILSFIQSSPDKELLTSSFFTEQLINNLAYRFGVSQLLAILHLNTPEALQFIPKDLGPIDVPTFLEAIETFDGSLGADRVIQYMVNNFNWNKEKALKSKRVVKNDTFFKMLLPIDKKSTTVTIKSAKIDEEVYVALTYVTPSFGPELYVTAMNSAGIDTSLIPGGTALIDLSKQCTQVVPFNILIQPTDDFIIYGTAVCDAVNYFVVIRCSKEGRLLQFMRYKPIKKPAPSLKKNE